MSGRQAQQPAAPMDEVPPPWLEQLERMVAADPRLTLLLVAEWVARNPVMMGKELPRPDRRDPLDRIEPAQHRGREPRLPGWGAVVEAVLIADPALSLNGLAERIGRHPDLVADELAQAGRHDLLRQLDHNGHAGDGVEQVA